MRFVEATGAAWTAEQLRAAEAELEAQKREWEANRLAAMQKEEQLLKQETEAEELLTYSRKDASNQVNTTKQDQTSLSKRTAPGTSGAGAAGVGAGGGFDELGIRLTKNNKRDKRFKHHGVNRGAGLNRSLSNKQMSTTVASVQQVSPVRTRRNSLLNVSAPARSSGNNSKKAEVPARRQTRLHSLGGATLTPPTRKTTRTAVAAAAAGAGSSSAAPAADTSFAAADEQRPKRQSANIAMSKLMKTPVKTIAAASKNTSAAKTGRRVSVSLTSTSAGQKKLLERRATISAPMALKQIKQNKSYASGVDDDEDDKDEPEDEDEDDDADAESVSVEIDETEADEEEDTILSASASPSPSAPGDTTQTEDEEEMHVERLNDEVDENDEEEDEDDKEDENDDEEEDTQGESESVQEAESDADVNVETQSSSSYATAGDGAKSLDAWSAHDQVQDTTMTTSTYYNVSEESDTDDPNDPLSLSSKAETKSEIKESTPALQRNRKRTSSSRSRGGVSDDAGAVVGHTPRTRSRGSVKINLWKLDVSPVLTTQKPSSAVKVVRRSTPRSETSQTSAEAPQKRPVGRKSLTKKSTEESGSNQSTKLTRWITKTPRGRPKSSSNNPSTISADNSSNGAGSSNR